VSAGWRVELARGVMQHVKQWRGHVVFIHINKTGGTSNERALQLRSERICARDKLARMGARRWQRAFKFAFVRNPWDKVVSHYHYRVSTGRSGLQDEHFPFAGWVRLAYRDRDPRYCDVPLMFAPQLEWIVDARGQIMVDFVGRFERLHEDFAAVCRRIGAHAALPHVKPTAHGDYRDFYDAGSRAIIARAFAPDLEQFGYRFQPGSAGWRSCGNSSTSRMLGESVSSMTRRSTPIPRPAAGGMPYSRARM
jgi:hypothetical protein